MAIYTLEEILKKNKASVKDIKKVGVVQPSTQNETGGFSETMQDIKQTGSNLLNTAKTTFGKQKEALDAGIEGKQGLLRSFGQAFGIGAGGVAQGIGDVVTGGVKAVLPQGGEDTLKEGVASAVAPIVQSDFAQNILSKYESLDEKQKRDVDALLGVGALATEFIGGGLAKKPLQAGAKATVSKADDIVRAGINKIDDVANNITLPEVAGDLVKPEAIMQRVARVNPSEQVKFKDISGETVGEYLTNRKIFGDQEQIATKLVQRFQESKNTADKALAGLQGNFKPTPVKTILNDLFNKEKTISSPGALSKDFKRVQELKNKFDKDGLTMSEINEVKRLFERNVKLDFVKQNLPDGVKKANTLDDAVRKWQFEQAEKLGLKNLPEINNETRYAKMLADALGKKLAGSSANNAVSLTDWVALSGGDPTSVAMFVGKKIFSSAKLQSKIAEKLSSKNVKKTIKAEYGKRKPDLTDFLTK